MSNIDDIVSLVMRLQILAKAEWGEEYLDCDCGHAKDSCQCDCLMCVEGWKLTEYAELHEWEKKLLPIITSRNPKKYETNHNHD